MIQQQKRLLPQGSEVGQGGTKRWKRIQKRTKGRRTKLRRTTGRRTKERIKRRVQNKKKAHPSASTESQMKLNYC